MEDCDNYRAVFLGVVGSPLSFSFNTSRGRDFVGMSTENETIEYLLRHNYLRAVSSDDHLAVFFYCGLCTPVKQRSPQIGMTAPKLYGLDSGSSRSSGATVCDVVHRISDFRRTEVAASGSSLRGTPVTTSRGRGITLFEGVSVYADRENHVRTPGE